jgi:hypothetical protein
LRIQHFADNSKPRSSYLPLLLLDVEENPENDRNTYYAARELMYYGRTEESVAMFKKHLSLKSATWDAERAFSMRYIAKQSPVGSYEREQWLLRAVAEWGHGRECWVELAQHYQDTKNWVGMFDAANRALSITNRGDLYLTEAVMWGWLPHDLCALAAANLDMMAIAVAQGISSTARTISAGPTKRSLPLPRLGLVGSQQMPSLPGHQGSVRQAGPGRTESQPHCSEVGRLLTTIKE